MTSESHKNIKIEIIHNHNASTLFCKKNQRLLEVLQENKITINAPCGGKHICKACKLHIENEGIVIACEYIITRDIKIHLLSNNQAKAIHNSYIDSRKINYNSGFVIKTDNNQPCLYYQNKLIDNTLQTNNVSIYGIAIDIGTTSIVIYLENLEKRNQSDVLTFLNPQCSFGHDIITRINYIIENPNGLNILNAVLINSINNNIETICNQNNIDTQSIYKVVVTGNSTMLHIFWNIDPSCISIAPFSTKFNHAIIKKTAETLLKINNSGIVESLPLISAYIGADVVSGIASLPIIDSQSPSLYIDIGTNGEMALLKNNKIYCCATAAGPAFEGAGIECGMTAINGAIASFVNCQTMLVIGNVTPLGICGSGLIDIIAYLLDNHYIEPSGFMDKKFFITDTIYISPQDIRQIQLAKASIAAGIKTLLKITNTSFNNISKVYIAGGLGNYLSIKNAIRIGLLPAELSEKIVTVGNSAGTGARFALQSLDFYDHIKHVINKAEYIELAGNTVFMEEYINSMNFNLIQ